MTLIERHYRSKASVLTLPPSKEKAIGQAVAAMAAELKLGAAEITAAVLAREKVMSTGIGQGIAIRTPRSRVSKTSPSASPRPRRRSITIRSTKCQSPCSRFCSHRRRG